MFKPTRRRLLAGALAAHSAERLLSASSNEGQKPGRAQSARALRKRLAESQGERPLPSMAANGDETKLPNFIASFAKGLPQNQFGEVESRAYNALLAAIASGKHADFERVPKGGGRKLNNPEAAFTFHLEGGDPHTFEIPPAPSITSPEAATEASELYWQALSRDVPFSQYASSKLVGNATDNNAMRRSGAGVAVVRHIFRAHPGDTQVAHLTGQGSTFSVLLSATK